MQWHKKNFIYGPDGNSIWAKNSALQPTPILLNEDVIRVYTGFRDEFGRSRIGYVDVDSSNPSNIKKVSQQPVLDLGQPGMFDENGVVPCAVVRRDNLIYLYYAGYQLGQKVRFYVFSGLAISHDNGESFVRYQSIPIMDRTDDEPLFRVIHSLIYDEGIWRVWYGGGNRFIDGEKKSLPYYDIRYIECQDGIHFLSKGKVVIPTKGAEHRVGRPYVIRIANKYKMFFGGGTEASVYRLAYAESEDGVHWERNDGSLDLELSPEGWDSQMMAYPAVIKGKNDYYLFYNGNNYGYDGFGYAVLGQW